VRREFFVEGGPEYRPAPRRRHACHRPQQSVSWIYVVCADHGQRPGVSRRPGRERGPSLELAVPSGSLRLPLAYNGKTTENLENVPWWFKGGVVLEADPAGKILWEYRHPYHHHDGRRLANGNTIVLTLETIPDHLARRVQGGLPGTEWRGGSILADAVHEVTPAGETVWTWHASEHLDPDVDHITANDRREEWTHGNAVGELADGSIILGFRNLSTVVIVSRPAGKVIWKLGPETLSHQHHPRQHPGVRQRDESPRYRPEFLPRDRGGSADEERRLGVR